MDRHAPPGFIGLWSGRGLNLGGIPADVPILRVIFGAWCSRLCPGTFRIVDAVTPFGQDPIVSLKAVGFGVADPRKTGVMPPILSSSNGICRPSPGTSRPRRPRPVVISRDRGAASCSSIGCVTDDGAEPTATELASNLTPRVLLVAGIGHDEGQPPLGMGDQAYQRVQLGTGVSRGQR